MVNKSMSIGEVLTINRNTVPIFMSFGMHCLGCPSSQMESLNDAAFVHGLDPQKVVDAVNAALAEN